MTQGAKRIDWTLNPGNILTALGMGGALILFMETRLTEKVDAARDLRVNPIEARVGSTEFDVASLKDSVSDLAVLPTLVAGNEDAIKKQASELGKTRSVVFQLETKSAVRDEQLDNIDEKLDELTGLVRGLAND